MFGVTDQDIADCIFQHQIYNQLRPEIKKRLALEARIATQEQGLEETAPKLKEVVRECRDGNLRQFFPH